MKRLALCTGLALLGLGRAEAQSMTNAPPAPAPIVFFDIAGSDAAKLKTFYAANFGWSIDGANGIKTPKLDGTLRQDPPETLIYLGFPTSTPRSGRSTPRAARRSCRAW